MNGGGFDRIRRRLGSGRDASAEPEIDESRLLWIWGSPRSGSSWLLQMLSHPLEVDMHAALGFERPPRDVVTDVLPVDELNFASHLVPWSGEGVEVQGRWIAGSIPAYSENRPTYFLASQYAHAWEPEARRLVLRRLAAVREHVLAAGVAVADDPLTVIKEVPSSHGADRVMALLPRSRGLLLIRDPRDVVDSLLHAFAPGGFMARQYGMSYGTPAEREVGTEWAAKQWAVSVDVGIKALESHDPELSRIVRYEDLLAKPAAEMAALFAWAGLDRDPAWVERMASERSFGSIAPAAAGAGERNRTATPGLWRENLAAREQEIVARVVGDRVERFGYEP